MDFEKLSQELYLRAGHHRFAKKKSDFDSGYLKISNWMNELCYYYLNKRKSLDKEMQSEFESLIKAKKEKIQGLKSSEYKEGLLKAIDEC